MLHRADGAAWTVSDAPLLDELVELLGPAPEQEDHAARGRRHATPSEVLHAARTRTTVNIAGEDADELRATDFVDRRPARRAAGLGGRSPARRRAGGRRSGVDLRAPRRRRGAGAVRHGLARAGLRRCPSRSISAVGDLAQTQRARGRAGPGPTCSPRIAVRPLHPPGAHGELPHARPRSWRQRLSRCPRTSATGCRSRCGATGEPPAPRRALERAGEALGRVGPGHALAVITADPAALPARRRRRSCTPRARRRAWSSTWWPSSTRRRSGRPVPPTSTSR